MGESARITDVSPRSLQRWKRKQAAGASVAPGHSPGGPRKITSPEEAALRAQVAAAPDATLAEHGAAWVAGGHRAVSRAWARLGPPLTKRR